MKTGRKINAAFVQMLNPGIGTGEAQQVRFSRDGRPDPEMESFMHEDSSTRQYIRKTASESDTADSPEGRSDEYYAEHPEDYYSDYSEAFKSHLDDMGIRSKGDFDRVVQQYPNLSDFDERLPMFMEDLGEEGFSRLMTEMSESPEFSGQKTASDQVIYSRCVLDGFRAGYFR